VLFAAFISRCALKYGVKAVSTVIYWPQSQFVCDRPCWKIDLKGHGRAFGIALFGPAQG